MNKSKLMKRAWKIATIGYLNTLLRSLEGKFPRRTIKNCLIDSIGDKQYWLGLSHVKKKISIVTNKRDFFRESLKQAWAEFKKAEKKEFEKTITEIEEEHSAKNKIANMAKIAIANANAPRRELVPAGKYNTGATLMGFIITGIGQSFRPNSDMFSLGITPDTEYVEYAYFN